MPAEVKILLEGYTNADSVAETGEEKTQPTITLVKDKDVVMVVDPGILDSQQLLAEALSREGLGVDDVNVVCITHSHIDHYRNIGMFPNAKTLEFFGLWDGNKVEEWSKDFSENIQILRTPGHDYTGISLLVNTENGIIAVCGDIFWKENYPASSKDDIYASDHNKLKKSREMILKLSDWIIPGHGPMYKNDREEVKKIDDIINKQVPIREFPSSVMFKCRKCGREMAPKDKCQCRPFICYKCCECSLDCYACSCSHRVF